jgi:hypothetical protein
MLRNLFVLDNTGENGHSANHNAGGLPAQKPVLSDKTKGVAQ